MHVHEPLVPRDQEHRGSLEEVHDEQVEQRRHAQREREPAHGAHRGDVEHHRGDHRHEVGRHDRLVRALERRLHGRTRRLARAHLVLQPFEEHDVGVGGHAQGDHEARDAGQGERVAHLRPGDRDDGQRQDRPGRHAEPRHDAQQPVIEEQVEEQQDQARDPGHDALTQRLLAQRGAHGLHRLPRQFHRQRTGVQHGRQVLGLGLVEAAADHAAAVRDGVVDRGIGDHARGRRRSRSSSAAAAGSPPWWWPRRTHRPRRLRVRTRPATG